MTIAKNTPPLDIPADTMLFNPVPVMPQVRRKSSTQKRGGSRQWMLALPLIAALIAGFAGKLPLI